MLCDPPGVVTFDAMLLAWFATWPRSVELISRVTLGATFAAPALVRASSNFLSHRPCLVVVAVTVASFSASSRLSPSIIARAPMHM